MAGTFLGIYLIWQRLGLINLSELLWNNLEENQFNSFLIFI
jgi:hypothetical protein